MGACGGTHALEVLCLVERGSRSCVGDDDDRDEEGATTTLLRSCCCFCCCTCFSMRVAEAEAASLRAEELGGAAEAWATSSEGLLPRRGDRETTALRHLSILSALRSTKRLLVVALLLSCDDDATVVERETSDADDIAKEIERERKRGRSEERERDLLLSPFASSFFVQKMMLNLFSLSQLPPLRFSLTAPLRPSQR